MTRLIDELLAAFNAHDAAAVGEFLSPDVQYIHWFGDSWVTLHGRHAVVALLDGYDRDWSSDFALRETFAVVADHGFAIEYVETGTQDRGASPSDRQFSLRNVMVGELRNGKIGRLTDYSDVTAYRAQMA